VKSFHVYLCEQNTVINGTIFDPSIASEARINCIVRDARRIFEDDQDAQNILTPLNVRMCIGWLWSCVETAT